MDRKSVSVKSAAFSPSVPPIGLRERNGYKLYQPFAPVGVGHHCSYVNILAPCGGSLFSITGEFSGESEYGAHDVVV